MHQLGDVIGNRRAGQMAECARDPPFRSDEGDRYPTTAPSGLQRGDRSGCDHVHRLRKADSCCGDERVRGVTIFDHGEWWVGEDAERDRGHAQEASEWRRHVRTEHRCQSDCADGHPDPLTDACCCAFDRVDGVAPSARRQSWSRFVGACQRASGPAVDLDSAANDDVLERGTLGGRAENRRRRLIGEHRCSLRCCTGIGLPHADMDQDVRVEVDHRLHDSVVLVGMNSVKHRTMEPSSRRISVDPRESSNPILGFEETRHQRAELASDAAEEDAPPSHVMNASPTRRQMIGSALGLVGLGLAARWGSAASVVAQTSAASSIQQAVSASEPAERLRLPGILTFPVELTADLVLLDNFGGPSFSQSVHRGIDIGRVDQLAGQPLLACVDGVLAEQEILGQNQGNSWVIVDSIGDGYRYHHLETFTPGLQVGDRVERGQVIATMGNTGNANVPHLHFEVRRGGPIGTAVDPVPLLGLPLPGVTVY